MRLPLRAVPGEAADALTVAPCPWCSWVYSHPDPGQARAAAAVHRLFHAYLTRRETPRATSW